MRAEAGGERRRRGWGSGGPSSGELRSDRRAPRAEGRHPLGRLGVGASGPRRGSRGMLVTAAPGYGAARSLPGMGGSRSAPRARSGGGEHPGHAPSAPPGKGSLTSACEAGHAPGQSAAGSHPRKGSRTVWTPGTAATSEALGFRLAAVSSRAAWGGRALAGAPVPALGTPRGSAAGCWGAGGVSPAWHPFTELPAGSQSS